MRVMSAGGKCCPREALICLILTLIAWVPGFIYSCVIIHQTSPTAVLSSTPPAHLTFPPADANSGAARPAEPTSASAPALREGDISQA
jgi:hypothetical protein